MQITEKKWLSEARNLEEGALVAIYDAHSAELYRYAYRLLGDAHASEDLVSETFMRFLKALQAGGGPTDHLRAYLYRVAHNLAIDQKRRQTITEETLDDDAPHHSGDAAPDEVVETRIAAQQARDALWHITPDQRQVIMLKYFQGLNNAETAAALGKPVGAIKSLQHRGLKAMRRVLDIDLAESDEMKVSSFDLDQASTKPTTTQE